MRFFWPFIHLLIFRENWFEGEGEVQNVSEVIGSWLSCIFGGEKNLLIRHGHDRGGTSWGAEITDGGYTRAGVRFKK